MSHFQYFTLRVYTKYHTHYKKQNLLNLSEKKSNLGHQSFVAVFAIVVLQIKIYFTVQKIWKLFPFKIVFFNVYFEEKDVKKLYKQIPFL